MKNGIPPVFSVDAQFPSRLSLETPETGLPKEPDRNQRNRD
jgi:hypothetical protein